MGFEGLEEFVRDYDEWSDENWTNKITEEQLKSIKSKLRVLRLDIFKLYNMTFGIDVDNRIYLKDIDRNAKIAIIPYGVHYIEEYKEMFKNIKLVAFPSTLEAIPCFKNLKHDNLEIVIIGDGIKAIPNMGFHNCKSIKQVRLGRGLQYIGPYAFEGCRGLTKLEFKENIVAVGSHAFNSCTNLKDINFTKCIKLEALGTQCFEYCINLTKVNFPEQRVVDKATLGIHTFHNCKRLLKLDVRYFNLLSELSFSGCDGLEELYFNEDNMDRAFKEMLYLHTCSDELIRKNRFKYEKDK